LSVTPFRVIFWNALILLVGVVIIAAYVEEGRTFLQAYRDSKVTSLNLIWLNELVSSKTNNGILVPIS